MQNDNLKFPSRYVRAHQVGNKFLWGALLVSLGILFRTVWHIAPNVEYVTAASLLAGVYLGRKYAILVPFTIMVLSDTLIGNTNIFVFTWSGYLMIGLFAYKGSTLYKVEPFKIPMAAGMGIVAALWFYLWTNFGVWALDSWGLYPRTVGGLMESYIMGLPFLKMNLLGNLFFVPVSFGVVEGVKSLYAAKPWSFHFLLQR